MADERSDKPAVPAGYRQDAQGRLVPEQMVAPIDAARDELVLELAAIAERLSRELVTLKQKAFGDIQSFVDMSVETYGAKRRGTKGNVTLYSFDGQWKIVYACQERLAFDERLQAAKGLVDACILDWSQGTKPEIQALIQDAFAVDQQGKLQVGRILQLRRLKIDEPRWRNAMRAIGDSVQVIGSKSYVRFYRRRGTTDQYDAVSLDIASL